MTREESEKLDMWEKYNNLALKSSLKSIRLNSVIDKLFNDSKGRKEIEDLDKQASEIWLKLFPRAPKGE